LLLSLCSPPSPCLSPFESFFAPREALAVLVPLLILCVVKIKSLPSQQLLLSQSRNYSQNTANRKAQHLLGMVYAKNARKTIQTTHLSNSVYLTMQAWLDCHPRD
jgi:hypothetical protein